MSDTLLRIQELIHKKEIRISEHGYEELVIDELTVREIVEGIEGAIVVEDYPNYFKGPCVLVLQKDKNDKPIHVVWGIPKSSLQPAVKVSSTSSTGDGI